MMYFIFSLIAILCWSGSDFFSKKGTIQNDKYSEWRIIFSVGIIMGLHAILSIILSLILDLSNLPDWLSPLLYTDFKPIDFIRYLPVSAIYILAMFIGYKGLKYIELSVSSPICNSSGSLALLICIVLGFAKLDLWSIIAVILISLGILSLSIIEYTEDDEIKKKRLNKSNFKYTKSLLAIAIPIVYLIMDALGTVGDQLIYELNLFELSDYSSNTSFEFTFLCFAIFSFIYIRLIKKQKMFYVKTDENATVKRTFILDGILETIGQIFYMSVMFSDFDAGIPMISSYCVLSVIWSGIFLKEKLSYKHYIAIITTLLGIILLGVVSPI